MYLNEEKILLRSANMNKTTMKRLSELNILITGDMFFVNKIKDSIKKHIKNSEKVEKIEQLKINQFRAFLEGLFC